jgi:soluble lytic murein transglycosylase-like protein
MSKAGTCRRRVSWYDAGVPRWSLAALAVLLASPAGADTFYVCRKAGSTETWANTATVKRYQRMGFRCRSQMKFKSTPRASAAAPSRTEPGTAAAPPSFRGPAGDRTAYEPFILAASTRYNVPADLIRAVIEVESRFHPRAVSHAGAQGLMQLMPETAEALGVTDAFDPEQNILGGARYIRILVNRFRGDPKLTLAAYHAGPNIVEERNGIPFKATERYVRRVLKQYYRYKGIVSR